VKIFAAACLLLFALVLTACSGLSQPAATPAPARTFTPLSALTATLAPTSTSLPPTEVPDVVSELAPEGEPATEWERIPIMPGAIAGGGDEESYVFTIQATPVQVQEYYRLELGRRGWWLLARGEGNTSSPMLVFTNNASETLTVSIMVEDDKALVLLVK
jgi:hypothetical protein